MPHLSPTTLTADEQRAILAATAGHPREHLIFSLALGTGLRLTYTHPGDDDIASRPRSLRC